MGGLQRRWFCAGLLLLTLWLCGRRNAAAYSLLTHEQLIDLTWNDSIVPLLRSRYPALAPLEIEHARAYAYGGCVIQDIGYYPFGDRSFSNLTHYVRTGDFVVALFRNAGNADELAFAVGALSHYIGDVEGHSLATNLAVPVEFPKLGAKYGRVVSYGEGERQHVQTEFAFDVNELAHHRMAPFRYQKHIGLEVPVRQLALAYYQTYGLTEDFSGTHGRRFNVGAYRSAVRAFIPRVARALTILHREIEPHDPNNAEIIELRKEVAVVAAENHWDEYRHKAGIGIYSLAALIFILPKIGPLKLAAIKGPTVATEADYVHSVAICAGSLRRLLARFTPPSDTRSMAAPATSSDTNSQPPPSGPLQANVTPKHATPTDPRDPRDPSDPYHPLKNRDLDTGYVVRPGGYALTDATYADLLHRLTRQTERPIPPGIKEDIQAFYSNLDLPITTKNDPDRWKEVRADIAILKTMQTSPQPTPYPTYGDDQPDEP
jgi:hypothetical protein